MQWKLSNIINMVFKSLTALTHVGKETSWQMFFFLITKPCILSQPQLKEALLYIENNHTQLVFFKLVLDLWFFHLGSCVYIYIIQPNVKALNIPSTTIVWQQLYYHTRIPATFFQKKTIQYKHLYETAILIYILEM